MYNAEKFIFKAVASVLQQTYSHFELIITDDGSGDGSLEIVKSFGDQRIKIVSDNQNRGISFRLNQQIELAKGKYFVRMDSDDIMFPRRLEEQIRFLENNPEIDAVGSSVVILDDDNNIVSFRKAVLLTNYEDLFSRILFNHPTVSGKITFFRKYRYSPDLDGVEDADLWIRSFPESMFHVMEEPLLFYRDPLSFKLATYKFRMEQKNKLYRNNLYLRSKPLLKTKLILLNNIKKTVSALISATKQDKFLISRRNSNRAAIREEWRTTLRNILNEK